MNKVILIVFSGLLAVQLVSAQSHTTWAAAQVPGLGRMTPPTTDYPEYMLHMAVGEIMRAPTENKAAYAAAKVYNPVMDMSDKVQQALEDKVLQLRHPPGTPYYRRKLDFDVMQLVIGAYYKTLNISAPQQLGSFYGPPPANHWAGASQPVGPPARQPGPLPPAGPPAGPAMGPPTSIRRGFRPRAPGIYSPFEPTPWELDRAVQDIHMARTEKQAVKAAAGVHRIGLDLADIVVNALEEKIARLRRPNWTGFRPPPIPRGLNVHGLVRHAFYEIQRIAQAKAAADAAAAAAAAAKAKKTPPPPTPRAGSKIPTTLPPTPPPKPYKKPRQPSKPNPPPSPKKTKPPKRDFMTDFIQNRRKQRQPPPAPKLFKQAQITRPPFVQPVRRQTLNPFPTQPSVPPYFEPTKITRPPYVQPQRRDPVDPFFSQPSYRPKPQVEPFRPPPNVPRPPKINWKKKAAAKPVPTSVSLTEKGPTSISAASSNSNKSPVSYETIPSQNSAKPAFMKIPKPNVPPAPFRSEPPKPKSLFPKGNSGRPSDIPKAVLSSNKGKGKRPSSKTVEPLFQSTETTPSPEEQQLFNRYPGLFENKARMRVANLAQHRLETVGPSAEISKPPLKGPNPQPPKVSNKKMPVSKPPQQAAVKVAPKIIKPSKVWSPLGNLGSNINEILKFSIDGPSESVPIPTAAPLTTKAPTTTTKKPTTTTPRKQEKVKPIRKTKVKRRRKVVSKAKSKSFAIKLAKKKPEKPKKPQGADKLTQLHKLLEGISPSQLQTLVDLIKAKANEGKPKPLPKPEPLPKPKPIFAPPPPPVNKPRWQVPRGTNNLHGQQNSWKTNPFHIPSIQTNSNDQQQPRNAPKWQQKRRNMFNSRRKQQQFQRKQERMDVKGPGKNRQSVSPGSLSTTDVLGKFKPTQQTWQITKGQPKMPRRNNNRGISVGFPQPNKKPNRPNRPNNRGQGKKPQGPKGGGQTIGDMIQNMFKGGAPPGAAGGMPNMPGPLAGGGDAAGLGALLGLGESGGMPMMPPGQSGAGGLEALLAMGGGSGQGAGGGEGLGGLGALMGLGGAGGSGSNPLEALLGAGGRGPGSNPLEALMGAGGAGAGGNPLEALLGPGGTGTGSNPLEALMGAGGAGAGGNPLEALLGPGGAGGGSNPLDALLGAGGAASSNALGAFFGKEKPGKKGKPGRGRPPFGKPFRPPKGGPGSMFPFLGRNPMGPGRPLIPGMTPGQVSDLMGGRPGPVPMDIAHQADLMSKMGHTVDHIVDVLGDVLQHRRSMPGYAAAALAAGSFPGMGIGNAGGPRKPGRKQGRHV